MTNNAQDDQASFEAMASQFMQAVEKNQDALKKLMTTPQETITNMMDPFNVMGSLTEGVKQIAAQPEKLIQANMELWSQHLALWQNASRSMLGEEVEPVVKPEKGDRRFSGKDWEENQVFDFIRQSYLITSRWLTSTMANIEGLSEEDAHKIQFHTQQLADALSPSNFAMTNPEVIRETVESGGENLVKGMQNLQRDMEAGKGQLRITMADPDAFEIGVNVATAPGKVVFQNDIVQLIQFEPTTKKVYSRPLVIFPPWINKYYILDLQPKNSFIRWAVDQGYTVFVASWVNPDAKLAEKSMDDYLQEGILASIDAALTASDAEQVSLIGYCVAGTLTGAALAYMAAEDDNRVAATTFFAAQMDFSEAGDLKVFIDEKQLQSIDERMAEQGYLDGDAMYSTFSMLRANDLVWSFYVNNYLLGKDPLKFDLLFWNGDTTRMPKALHSFYLRQMYLHNALAKPGGISLSGVPIDLGKVKTPIYLQAAREDHIAPYNSVFKARQLFGGPVRFMLAGSGHIAGVVNPPAANKYNYWMNEEQPDDLDQWLAGAEMVPGSWWDDWDKWLSPQSGAKVAARKPGSGKLKAIEDAPGSFAKLRIS